MTWIKTECGYSVRKYSIHKRVRAPNWAVDFEPQSGVRWTGDEYEQGDVLHIRFKSPHKPVWRDSIDIIISSWKDDLPGNWEAREIEGEYTPPEDELKEPSLRGSPWQRR